MDQRRSLRFRARFDTLISGDSEEGAGILSEISYAGARVDEASTKPEVGTKVTLYVFIQPVAPFELHGEVVRHCEGGFAVEYKDLSDELRALVDEAAAVVSSIC